MSTPLPKDPLDDPITRFVAAVNAFLEFKAADLPGPLPEPPTKPQNLIEAIANLKQTWEEAKRHLRKIHVALVGAEPDVDERLQSIISVGAEVVALSDDRHIIGPVEDVVRMATEHRADIKSAVTRLGEATSLPTVLAVFKDLAGFGERGTARKKKIATALDSLTAYYLLQMPPEDSA